MTFGSFNLLLPSLIRDVQAKQLRLSGLEFLFLAEQPDVIVRKLEQPPLAFLLSQVETLGNVMQFSGNLAHDFFIAADRMLKHSNPPEAALIDISIYCARSDKINDGNGTALLTIAVDTADALLDPHRIPWQVIIDQQVTKLKVETFAARLRFWQGETTPQAGALVVGHVTVNHTAA